MRQKTPKKAVSPTAKSQQDFLREAMNEMGLTRDALSALMGIKRRGLDSWLLPDDSNGFRPMPEMARRLIECLKKQMSA